MKVIGFAEEFYTLWEVSEPYRKYRNEYNWVLMVDHAYIQNLSKDLEQAKAKVEGPYRLDLELRGQKGRFFSDQVGQGSDRPDWQFSFGKLEGQDIRVSDDVWQLERAYNSEKGARRRVYARRRLIELGKLVRYDFGKEFVKYWSPERVEELKKEAFVKSLKKGHHHKDGERVELNLKCVGVFSTKSHWGRFYIETYASSDGLMFKYGGSSPADISRDEYVPVVATISHDHYMDLPETKLKRIKVKSIAKMSADENT